MNSKILSIALLAAGMMMSACGGSQKNDDTVAGNDSTTNFATDTQAEADVADEEEYEIARRGIDTIREVWKSKPIKVNLSNTIPDVLQYAKAFCKTYPQCETNRALKEFLASPENAQKEEGRIELPSNDGEYTLNYHIDNKPRNGYISCEMAVETFRQTDVCYWNRKDGHKLIAVFIDECWESASWDQCLAVFYDYDPATDTMTPEPALTDMIEQRMKSYKCYDVKLPKEGKDIEVKGFNGGVNDEDEEPLIIDELKLKWNGQTFDWSK
ncbi:MAG: hypothetical protein IJ693_03090 [Bacteroidaceae bacterium]|nr:hypothetical protein [Bacteroidaceae bacterium]